MEGSDDHSYGIIILDQDEYEKKQFRKVIQNLRLELIEKRVPYTPKFISITNMIGQKRASKAKLHTWGIDYQLQKPYKQQNFIKMCKELQYDYKNSALSLQKWVTKSC